ncbi:alpha/beta fold hydrolase [Tenacibaculum ovolyticum]|uniref:alpha/beta fold hydrolase n=1 Tax=Tenacibaculum ovolyticum TaxID=104270 RepID=UPI001F18BF5F|nr:alpha/beta hydrolase [Tenacibaculum ovolyticum]
MKSMYLKIQLIAIFFCFITNGFAQIKDTLVDVGKYKLHFNIIKGNGAPILFESGSGNDATVWNDIIQPIAEITGATVITYDRAGLGKSVIKSDEVNPNRNGILENVKALEKGMKVLGYDNDIILVAHSLGGFYSTLFASRNKEKVKGAVFIDASLASFYTDSFVNKLNGVISDELLNKFRAEKIGLYYEVKNIENSLKLLKNTYFPSSVPVIDLVASNPYNPFKNEEDKNRWIKGHQNFVENLPNRELLIINSTSHFAFRDNPNLIINQVVKAYANTLDASKEKRILLRALKFSIKINNLKQ